MEQISIEDLLPLRQFFHITSRDKIFRPLLGLQSHELQVRLVKNTFCISDRAEVSFDWEYHYLANQTL